MANFGKDLQDRCVHIRSAEQTEHFTVYIISVTVGPYAWTVKHRYSEFHDLHERLTASFKLDKTLLPPKKLFGNQTEAFIKKRQRELEIYLQTIILYLAQHIPSCLAFFLDFDKYEIHGITQAMAEDLYNRGENLLQSREPYEVTSLQLYSLTERLKLPEPTCDSGDVKKDLGHILDFITRAKHLKVISSKKPVGSSNIVMSKLPFDLTLFKSLLTLEISGCNFRLVNGLETVKQTLTRFDVHESKSSIKEILLQDAPHWKAEDGSLIVGYWDLVLVADLSHNSFSDIPDCIQLMPNIENLNLSHNVIESIQNLQWLSQLTHLDLSKNNIRHVDSLHTKMGNVKVVKLAHNRLESLHGFAKLFSLEKLDVSHNKIVSIEELKYVSQLPCLEDLLLVGNAVTNTLDYRTKTLELFGDRVREVVLDKQVTDQKELDTVAVLQALQRAKDVKLTMRPKKNASAVSLSEYSQGSPTNSLTDNLESKTNRNDSPGPGVISRSVPSSTDWPRRESRDPPRSSNRSPSPYSQESVSSHSDTHEGEVGQIPEVHPFDFSAVPSSQGTAGQPVESSCKNVNNSNEVEDAFEEEIPHELVPEAHPFDLTIENPASLLSTSQQMSTSRRSLDLGQSPQKSLSTLSTTQKRQNVSSPLRSTSQTPSTASMVLKSGSEPLEPSALSPSRDMSRSLPANSGAAEKRTQMSSYNVADLPTKADHGFVLWLSEQLLTTGDVTPSHPGSDRHSGEKESILDILWCYAEQLSKPALLHPCCVVLTKNKIFIEKMVWLNSNFPGVPELEPFSIIPMGNLQQIVIGQCYSFLRLEEAFVGQGGTFTLFGVEPQGIKRFVNKLQAACLHLFVNSGPEYVNLTLQSDLLNMIVSREEEALRMASDRLAVALLVRLKGSSHFNFLVLSEYKVYCLDIAFIHWPPTSFETNPKHSITFNVLHEYSIVDTIRDIKIHPTQEAWSVNATNLEFVQYELTLELSVFNEHSKNTSPAETSRSVTDQSLIRSSITVAEHPQKKNTSISYLFPSAAQRDLFLDRLSNLRAEQAHRMSPSVREEPEGGNELVPLKDGNSVGKVWSLSESEPRKPDSKQTFLETTTALATPLSSALETRVTDFKSSKLHSNKTSNISISSSSQLSFKKAQLLKDIESLSISSSKSASITEIDIYDDYHSHSSPDRSLYYSTSPKDDLSISPMSNFSRASISPPVGQQEQGKKSVVYPSAVDAETTQAPHHCKIDTKADSLPSSFDWKQYYFRPSSNVTPGHDRKSGESTILQQSQRPPDHRIGLSLQIPKVFEDIESSTELDQTPSVETEHECYLKQCVKSYELIHPLPTKLKPLCLMNGRELKTFFHTMIAQNSPDVQEHLAEELHHVLWANIVPYTNPKHEIITLVMLSTHGIYFVSDSSPQHSRQARPSWMTHSRNQSDSAITWKSGDSDDSAPGKKVVKAFFSFRYSDILQVNIGLFDQCVRLTGTNDKSVFTIATRDSSATDTFVQKLKHILSLRVSSPMVEKTKSEIEQDFYVDSSQKVKATLEGFVYTHPSQVSFISPGEEAVQDILYLVNKRVSLTHTKTKAASTLWFYMQCYQMLSDLPDKSPPVSVIVTQTHFCLAEEDIVTYPLPDFVRGLPENPCHKIVECRRIDCLKRVTLYHGNHHWICLTFTDEVEDIVVDVSVEHFSPSSKGRLNPNPESTLKFFVQSMKERDKLVRVLEKLWKQLVSQVGRILDVHKV
ncbi:unnamed protein product [Lymnaea stagnalis]|uniref:PX domain-containing protein n=1 Tax=Lymnaea stagnalis TaxID=6523 RepID=A0AAV2HG87_LYMST